MTVVIGQHFFEGVIIIADSRSSIQKNGAVVPWRDNTQKIFFLTKDIVISFAGDVEFAGAIISFLSDQINKRPKLGILSIFITKGPRLIKYAYNLLSNKKGFRDVGFIIAGIDPKRPARVNDSNGKQTGYINIYDKKVLKVVSPDFETQEATIKNPFVIMGSGEQGIEGLEKDFQKLQFGQFSNNLAFQAVIIETSLRKKIESLGIDTVGGLSQIAIIDSQGARFQGYQGKRDPFEDGDLNVEMIVENGRFIQKDLKTGKEIKLLYPPEVLSVNEDGSDLFAELDNLK
ncbi:hypothetical protein COB87_002720 [Candidatus Wolfebacteria bacterium]|nr:hypothetical protein [Candidatus Wolfebacteria bacterium]